MKFLTILLMSILISCNSGDSGGSSSEAKSKYSGNAYWQGVQDNDDNDLHMWLISVRDNGTVKSSYLYAPGGNLTTVYYRYQEGSFTFSGDDYRFNWDYETCSPTGYEEYEVTGDASGKIAVKQGNTSVLYSNNQTYSPNIDENQIVTLVEDTNCNIIP